MCRAKMFTANFFPNAIYLIEQSKMTGGNPSDASVQSTGEKKQHEVTDIIADNSWIHYS